MSQSLVGGGFARAAAAARGRNLRAAPPTRERTIRPLVRQAALRLFGGRGCGDRVARTVGPGLDDRRGGLVGERPSALRVEALPRFEPRARNRPADRRARGRGNRGGALAV